MLRLTESVHTRLSRENTRSGLAYKRFCRNEEGSLIIFALFLFVLMMGIAGIGVDYMRYEAQRVRLQATLDRAVLAASSLSQPLDPQSVVLDYFDKAGLSAYISADDITVTENAISRHVDANVSMDMDTTLLRFANISTLNTPAGSAAEESISNTEISLILDVSGSMREQAHNSDSTKIQALREAATSFVNIVMCDPTNPSATSGCTVPAGLVSINLVPYSEQVLVGEDLLQRFNVTMEHTASSCVTFDTADFNTAVITPEQRIKRTGQIDPWGRRDNPAGAWGWTCQPDAWRAITPMEGDAAKLRSAIGNLDAGGSTSIELGMKWGSALLNTAFQPIVSDMVEEGKVDGAFAGRPSQTLSQKVIVLMTDGINTSQSYLYDEFRDGPSPVWRTTDPVDRDWRGNPIYEYSVYNVADENYWWVSEGIWQDHAYGSQPSYQKETCTGGYWDWNRWSGWHYVQESCSTETVAEAGNGAGPLTYPQLWAEKNWNWWYQFRWLPRPGTQIGYSDKDQRLETICTAAKNAGYIVFTVGFEVTSHSDQVMSNCASDPSKYFSADGSNISAAFASIALSISKLRLVN